MEGETAGRPLSDDECKAIRIADDELVFFNRQLASMCRLETPIAEGLRVLSKEVASSRMRDMVLEIEREVSNGSRLSQAVRKFPRVFPDLYVGLIEAGESSGSLSQVLEQLGEYSFSTYMTWRSLKATLTYPVVALCLILTVAAGLLVGIVPKFRSIFETLGVELPLPTRLMIGVSGFLTDYFVFAIAAIVAMGVLVYGLYGSTRGRRWIERALFNLPLTGAVYRNGAYFLFARTLSLLLRAGIPIARCLGLMRQVFASGTLHLVCSDMQRAAENGEAISKEAARGGFFPETFVWKVAFGERKGNLASALDELARFYDLETQVAAKRGTGLIEPLLIAVLAMFVGSIVLSIFLPILKIQETLRRK